MANLVHPPNPVLHERTWCQPTAHLQLIGACASGGSGPELGVHVVQRRRRRRSHASAEGCARVRTLRLPPFLPLGLARPPPSQREMPGARYASGSGAGHGADHAGACVFTRFTYLLPSLGVWVYVLYVCISCSVGVINSCCMCGLWDIPMCRSWLLLLLLIDHDLVTEESKRRWAACTLNRARRTVGRASKSVACRP